MRDIGGQRFGRLIVLSFMERRGKNRVPSWLCQCDCGIQKAVLAPDLIFGKTKSCGCLALEVRTKHGKVWSTTYGSWKAMKARCTNPNNIGYKNYGARGITVCTRWMESFGNFLADMGERPDGLTLERKDVNGNYEKSNCCWDTRKAQHRNRRETVFVIVNGERLPLVTAAERAGVDYNVAYERRKRGDSIERVLRL